MKTFDYEQKWGNQNVSLLLIMGLICDGVLRVIFCIIL